MPGKLKYLFYVERNLHVPVLEPLWQRVLSRNLGEAGLLLGRHAQLSSRILSPGTPVKGRPGLQVVSDPYAFRPDVTVLADHSYQDVEGMGFIVNIGHGTLSKGYYYLSGGRSRRENLADLLCVPGMVHKRTLAQTVFKPLIVTGMPKLDKLAGTKLARDEELTRRNLVPAWPTLLIAPTFNPELSMLPHLPANLRRVIPREINLIIKLHGECPEEYRNKIEIFAAGDSACHIVAEQDVTPYLALADFLFSDVSSVIYEFLSLKKPVILFDSPYQKSFLHYDPKNLEYQYRQVGTRISKAADLKQAISKALQPPSLSASKLRMAQAFLPVRGGSSTERVMNAIELAMRDQNKADTLILYHGNKTRMMPQRLQRLGQNFAVRYVQNQDYENFPWKEVKTQINRFSGKVVIFIQEGYEFSACFFQVMAAHFHYQKKLGMISPLVAGEGSQETVQPWLLGKQIGYELIGESLQTDAIYSGCFALPVALIKRFFTVNPKAMLEDVTLLVDFARTNRLDIRLALDALLFDPGRMEELDEYEEPVQEPQSLFLNLSGLAAPHHPRRLLDNVIKSYKGCNRTWTTAKQIHLLVELGAMHIKKGEYEYSMDLLWEARGINKQCRNRKVAIRLYYYLGFSAWKLKRKTEARRFLKSCLKLAPGHQSARKVLGQVR